MMMLVLNKKGEKEHRKNELQAKQRKAIDREENSGHIRRVFISYK